MNVIKNPGFPHPMVPYPKLIINACITGMVAQKQETPHIPVSEEEIIKDAISCCKAGACVIHLHARDAVGAPSYKKEIYGRLIKKIRQSCPDLIICASTSGRVYNAFEHRSQVLELQGMLKPDIASLTTGSLNFPQKTSVNTMEMITSLAEKMRNNGIMPEIEVFETGMINTAKILIKQGVLAAPFYFNIMLGSRYSAPATLPELCHMVNSLPSGSVWGAGGIGQFQLNVNLAAVLMGGHVRVGLEDNIYYDVEKEKFATNLMLIERIVKFCREIGREVATPREARQQLGL